MTVDAAAYCVLPLWLAVMEHVPVVISVTVVPETLQTEVLLDLNATVRPEVDEAEILIDPVVMAWGLSVPNVIVCGASVTEKV